MQRWITAGMRAAAAVLSVLLSAGIFSAAAYAEAALEEDYYAGEQETELSSEEYAEGVVPSDGETEEERTGVSVSGDIFPFYITDMETELDCPLYFINGVNDLPFINLCDWVDLMLEFNAETPSYSLELETDGHVAMLTRETGYSMMIDFEAAKILFEDFDAFVHRSGDDALLDSLRAGYSDENGNPLLIEKVRKGSYDRYGSEIELDLSAYSIPLYWSEEEELYLVPLQTLNDFLGSYVFGRSLLFNTKAVYFGDADDFGFTRDELSEFGESYYFSVPSGMMSEELAWYSYCELCLALDNLYGLKEIHDISSFDRIFTETGYRDALTSTDPNVKDGALVDFINYYLDDMHSGFRAASYLTDQAETSGYQGLAKQRDYETVQIYYTARENADHEIKAYEEVGNTAYITFDSFKVTGWAEDYYDGKIGVEEDPESPTLDTLALIMYAHEQIAREDSPIENVVIDLSLNGGGDIDAGAFAAAWYLGEASVSIRSSMTGAISTGTYRVDTNLDGVFDEQDTVRDKNLYCLTSPYSFSCGNLVPNIFRSSGRVTLLGKETGGGSCFVLPMSTAHGSLFDISSPKRMSYMKNGSYYDTDTGILPDCIIVRPEHFYDRTALTDYINQLF